MKCLVTGVAGFTGSSLAEKLVSLGHEVRGVDRFSDYYPREIKEDNVAGLRREPRFSFVLADLARADLGPLFAGGIDVVFHQAAQAGVRASWGKSFGSYVDDNILATERLLAAARAAGVKKFVYASSSSIYGDQVELPMRETALPRPFSPYGVTKLAAEHLVELYRQNFGLRAISLRYFTVYGPRQRPDMGFHKFIEAMLDRRKIVVFGDGEQTRDFTFVGDVVRANIRAAESDVEGVFNVGGGSRVTVNEVLATLGEIVGLPPEIDRRATEAGDVRHTLADAARARNELGFAPEVSLRDGLTAQVAWHRQRRAGTPGAAVRSP
jgi:nucleoside-diphosphate-sugar epimerase